jgi:hypothetical protein
MVAAVFIAPNVLFSGMSSSLMLSRLSGVSMMLHLGARIELNPMIDEKIKKF